MQPSTEASGGLPSDLELTLDAVERPLVALGESLRERDAAAIEQHAAELHRALAAAVQRFAQAARAGGVPPQLRQRLALATGQVAAQRESLARATASLDRAIEVLLPGAHASAGAAVYSAAGAPERSRGSGVAQA